MSSYGQSLTDTHCHLNDPRFAGRVGEVIAHAQDAGVGAIIVPGWDRESSLRALALAAAYPMLYAAVGLHPWFVAQKPDLAWLPPLLDDPRVIAVGEIGIDGAIADADIDQQEDIFRQQLLLATARQLPVLLHCRRGWDRLLAGLRESSGVRGVAHAFSGSQECFSACLRLGFYIAFAGMITRENSLRAHEAAAHTPADRLLLETDAPNMALAGIPAAQTEPFHLPVILSYVATLRNESPTTLAAQTASNAAALFGI